jgi:hypothetical protein
MTIPFEPPSDVTPAEGDEEAITIIEIDSDADE